MNANNTEWSFYEALIWKEVEILFPIIKRRDQLIHKKQRNGETFTEHYRNVEKVAIESKLGEMGDTG